MAVRSSSGRSGFLNWIEWLGNKLPDPAFLFLAVLLLTWVLSAILAPISFAELDPRTGQPIRIVNQLTVPALVGFLSRMVRTFVEFPPLGQVLVVLLGVGVAERAGLIQAVVKSLLRVTPRRLLTPMLFLVAILGHSAGDPAYPLVIPLGAAIFSGAGRHPLLGIAVAFAGISGAFSASFLPASLDPLLQGFTQKAAQMIEPERLVNPLCNWWFMSASSLLLIAVGWFVTDRVVEPRLIGVPVDGEGHVEASGLGASDTRESRGLLAALAVIAASGAALIWIAWPASSPLRAADGGLMSPASPLMQLIVPLIFLFFLLPGVAYGRAAGTLASHRDIVQGMTQSMGSISYYLVMVFFAAQFTAAFAQTNVGLLIAVKGGNLLREWRLPGTVALLGVIGFTALINLLIGSASAKWALLSPIFVPMLMAAGFSPELTQAAFRVGDSSTNIVTPLMPFFPLVVVYAQRYSRSAGVGTIVSLMLPYSISFLVAWSLLLLLFWTAKLPLGL